MNKKIASLFSKGEIGTDKPIRIALLMRALENIGYRRG
jgi:hypothetical protein